MNAQSSASIRALALGSFGVIGTFSAAAVVFHGLSWEVPAPSMLFGPRGFVPAFGLVFGAAGALIASRRPDNPIGWFCLGNALLATINGLAEGYAFWALLEHGGRPPLARWAGWITEWIWLLWLGATAVILAIFPDGRLRSRRWRNVIVIGCLGTAVATMGNALIPDLVIFSGFENPVGLRSVDADRYLQVVGGASWSFGLLLLGAGAASAIARFRGSRGDERQQLKWLSLAGALIALAATAFGVITVLTGSIGLIPSGFDWAEQLMVTSVFALPIAIAIAILKYRLYDIDVIINRALVYAVVTAILAVGYAGLVLGLQTVLPRLARDSGPAVAASTLAIAALFRPLRNRVQDFVDRSFYRRKYNAEKIIERFGMRLRDETDLVSLQSELLTVVREAMQPVHASLWFRPPRQSAVREQ